MLRFSTIAALASVGLLTACGQAPRSLPASPAACAPKPALSAASGSPLSALQPGILTARSATAAQLGLWPRGGPSVRVCGDVGNGFARCQAWQRTDIAGELRPGTLGGYAPSDLQTAYGLTAASENGGTGETVAIVDAYDDPNAAADLSAYRARFGLPACTVSNGCFTKRSFTSQTNAGWAAEESVDVDMVSAICPNCKILLVEAASNSIADFSTAEVYATSHGDYVSNSWGGDEGTTTYDADYSDRCGPIAAATGDHGYNPTAQWPAILPSVIGVGGTSLRSISPRVETAWPDAGSGCSRVYPKPSYQSGLNTGCSMRAEADVSADADPATGVAVYDTFDRRGWLVFGGTSVATAIVASVAALNGTGADLPGNLYSHRSELNDITFGSNGTCGVPLCTARGGWSGPTGLGTPKGITAF